MELAQVHEMAEPDANTHLIEAAPLARPPPDSVPAGAPLALWFLLRHPQDFREIFLHHEARDAECWQSAQGPPGLVIADLADRGRALADAVKEFFSLREGTGRFCAVEAYRLDGAYCFVAYVADRLHLLDGFTDAGERTTHRLRPAFPVVFGYSPHDGAVLLHSRLRAHDRVLDLVRRFGRAVLGVDLEERCLGQAFDLDRLKRDFRPLPDGDDVEAVRVKSLHLRYPARRGRRQVKLETLSGDAHSAMQELLRAHVPTDDLLDELQVSHAELQVRMRIDGRTKNYAVRLWPNRSNLSLAALDDRLRRCLKNWGLRYDVRQR